MNKETVIIFCPSCGYKLKHTIKIGGKIVGGTGGILSGALLGAKVGIAMGPLGAIAGTFPGAILGAVFGKNLGNKFDKPTCPQCKTTFDIPDNIQESFLNSLIENQSELRKTKLTKKDQKLNSESLKSLDKLFKNNPDYKRGKKKVSEKLDFVKGILNRINIALEKFKIQQNKLDTIIQEQFEIEFLLIEKQINIYKQIDNMFSLGRYSKPESHFYEALMIEIRNLKVDVLNHMEIIDVNLKAQEIMKSTGGNTIDLTTGRR